MFPALEKSGRQGGQVIGVAGEHQSHTLLKAPNLGNKAPEMPKKGQSSPKGQFSKKNRQVLKPFISFSPHPLGKVQRELGN